MTALRIISFFESVAVLWMLVAMFIQWVTDDPTRESGHVVLAGGVSFVLAVGVIFLTLFG